MSLIDLKNYQMSKNSDEDGVEYIYDKKSCFEILKIEKKRENLKGSGNFREVMHVKMKEI